MDYRRMEWQYKVNRIAVASMLLCCLMLAPEVYAAFRYHFPWWDEFTLVFTVVVMLVARFIQKKTEMYRWDH